MRKSIWFYIVTSFFCGLAKVLLKMRYRIEVHGLDEVKKAFGDTPKGVLFLPNHPAQIDPVILSMILWNRYHPRPLVLDPYYRLKLVGPLLRIARAIPVPITSDFINKWKRKRLEELYLTISGELDKKENFLIYPSGKLKLRGKEIVGGASLIHALLEKTPDLQIVLIRTTGLWGSVFSKAYTRQSPNFARALLFSVKATIKNLFFFLPKRKIKIEFVPAPNDFPRNASRDQCNQYLENWYNNAWTEGEEPLTRVSYSFWKEEVLSPYNRPKPELKNAEISANIRESVLQVLSKAAKRSKEEIKDEMTLSADLRIDSLDMMQIILFLDTQYDAYGVTIEELQTVQDVMLFAAGVKKPEASDVDMAFCKIPKELSRKSVLIPEGKTIPEVFIKNAKRMDENIACADLASGSIRYHALLVRVLLLAAIIRKREDSYIGILLPSSITSYAIVLATLLAGKVPVMLNWTVGVRSLNHAKGLLDLKTVYTSSQFLEKIEQDEFGDLEQHFVFLEKVAKGVSLLKKLSATFNGMFFTNQILKKYKLKDRAEDDPAVILFTSGTESLPKAVPLTHKNILSNQRAALSLVDFNNKDTFYGVLPPFHSFGFSVTGLLPLLCGLKVIYSPNPTDHIRIAEDINQYKVTLFCCAPSFMQPVFKVAGQEKLSSVRLFVTGAEKASNELFAFVGSIPSKLIEGYGITECSPVVTLNLPSDPPKGVGKPLPGIKLRIVNEESKEVLGVKKEGEICIFGPSVFPGYLGIDKDPFMTIEGDRYYRSGDRGYLEEDGSLVLAGRASRFVKIGGEMVGLNGLEEEIQKIFVEKGWKKGDAKGPFLAVMVKHKEAEKPEIILLTKFFVDKEEVNLALKQSGHGRIAQISEVKAIDDIPVTATGKVHYSVLEEKIKS